MIPGIGNKPYIHPQILHLLRKQAVVPEEEILRTADQKHRRYSLRLHLTEQGEQIIFPTGQCLSIPERSRKPWQFWRQRGIPLRLPVEPGLRKVLLLPARS